MGPPQGSRKPGQQGLFQNLEPPRGSPRQSKTRDSPTCAGARPVSGAHEAPHGVIAGVAVLPVEAVPATCGHSPHVRARARRGLRPPRRLGPGTHLPEKGATADCPWIPSGSSCGGGGRRAGRVVSSGDERVIPPVARRTLRPHEGASGQVPQSARGPPAVAVPGGGARRAGRAARGCVVRGKSPRPAPRGTRCNLGARGREGGGAVFAGLGISWDARRCLETGKRPLQRRVRGAGSLGPAGRSWKGAGVTGSSR